MTPKKRQNPLVSFLFGKEKKIATPKSETKESAPAPKKTPVHKASTKEEAPSTKQETTKAAPKRPLPFVDGLGTNQEARKSKEADHQPDPEVVEENFSSTLAEISNVFGSFTGDENKSAGGTTGSEESAQKTSATESTDESNSYPTNGSSDSDTSTQKDTEAPQNDSQPNSISLNEAVDAHEAIDDAEDDLLSTDAPADAEINESDSSYGAVEDVVIPDGAPTLLDDPEEDLAAVSIADDTGSSDSTSSTSKRESVRFQSLPFIESPLHDLNSPESVADSGQTNEDDSFPLQEESIAAEEESETFKRLQAQLEDPIGDDKEGDVETSAMTETAPSTDDYIPEVDIEEAALDLIQEESSQETSESDSVSEQDVARMSDEDIQLLYNPYLVAPGTPKAPHNPLQQDDDSDLLTPPHTNTETMSEQDIQETLPQDAESPAAETVDPLAHLRDDGAGSTISLVGGSSSYSDSILEDKYQNETREAFDDIEEVALDDDPNNLKSNAFGDISDDEDISEQEQIIIPENELADTFEDNEGVVSDIVADSAFETISDSEEIPEQEQTIVPELDEEFQSDSYDDITADMNDEFLTSRVIPGAVLDEDETEDADFDEVSPQEKTEVIETSYDLESLLNEAAASQADDVDEIDESDESVGMEDPEGVYVLDSFDIEDDSNDPDEVSDALSSVEGVPFRHTGLSSMIEAEIVEGEDLDPQESEEESNSIPPDTLDDEMGMESHALAREEWYEELSLCFDEASQWFNEEYVDESFSLSFAQMQSIEEPEQVRLLFDLANDELLDPSLVEEYLEEDDIETSSKAEVEANALSQSLEATQKELSAPRITMARSMAKKSSEKKKKTPVIQQERDHQRMRRIKKPSVALRFFAFLIDILGTVVSAGLLLAMSLYAIDEGLLNTFLSGEPMHISSYYLLAEFAALSLLAALVLYPFAFYLCTQQTLGNKVTQTRLVSCELQSASIYQIALRSMIFPLSFLCFGYLPLLFGKNALHDYASQTAMTKISKR